MLHTCHIPTTTHTFRRLLNTLITERISSMKMHFAYYNKYKNGIDITFTDNVPALSLMLRNIKRIFIPHQTLKGLLIILQSKIHLNMLHYLLMGNCRHGRMQWMIGVYNMITFSFLIIS